MRQNDVIEEKRENKNNGCRSDQLREYHHVQILKRREDIEREGMRTLDSDQLSDIILNG